ncbi:PepSY domain-containing protein [Mesorhizobium sp. M0016]|uniref:hypothetical protein n=1 Tax=Mesorhizobium sp. M0016 TaxID=2956843 RepID=UPI003336F486
MNPILISALFHNRTTVGAALAGGKSDVGIAEWRPRQAVLTKLEAARRQIHSIKTEDGWPDAVEPSVQLELRSSQTTQMHACAQVHACAEAVVA